MALLDRLRGSTDDTVVKLAIGPFNAAIRELARGVWTQAQIVSYMDLSAAEEDDLQVVVNKYQASANKPEFLAVLNDSLILSEQGAPGYQTGAQILLRLNDVG